MNYPQIPEPLPARPVLMPEGLQLLIEDVGSESAHDFLNAYLRLLPSRSDGIVGMLAGGDVEGARKAVSSLHVTSSMAGATRLEDYCRALLQQLALGSLPDADTVKAVLRWNVSLLSQEIPQLLGGRQAGDGV
jgi:HPt (histidine-containing phosphotransfer) domain-containing protein